MERAKFVSEQSGAVKGGGIGAKEALYIVHKCTTENQLQVNNMHHMCKRTFSRPSDKKRDKIKQQGAVTYNQCQQWVYESKF